MQKIAQQHVTPVSLITPCLSVCLSSPVLRLYTCRLVICHSQTFLRSLLLVSYTFPLLYSGTCVWYVNFFEQSHVIRDGQMSDLAIQIWPDFYYPKFISVPQSVLYEKVSQLQLELARHCRQQCAAACWTMEQWRLCLPLKWCRRWYEWLFTL